MVLTCINWKSTSKTETCSISLLFPTGRLLSLHGKCFWSKFFWLCRRSYFALNKATLEVFFDQGNEHNYWVISNFFCASTLFWKPSTGNPSQFVQCPELNLPYKQSNFDLKTLSTEQCRNVFASIECSEIFNGKSVQVKNVYYVQSKWICSVGSYRNTVRPYWRRKLLVINMSLLNTVKSCLWELLLPARAGCERRIRLIVSQ